MLRSCGPTGQPGCQEWGRSAAVTAGTVPVNGGGAVVVVGGGVDVVGALVEDAPDVPPAWGELVVGVRPAVGRPRRAVLPHEAAPTTRTSTERTTGTMADPEGRGRRARRTTLDATGG